MAAVWKRSEDFQDFETHAIKSAIIETLRTGIMRFSEWHHVGLQLTNSTTSLVQLSAA